MRSSNSEIEKYIDASRTASDRVRYVMLILVTSSIISFAAFWNSRDNGWVSERLHLATVALKFCSQPSSGLSQTQTNSQPNKKKDDQDDEPKFNDKDIINHLPAEDTGLISRAQDFYRERHFHSCVNLSYAVQELEKINTQDVNYIHVPALGFSFDINDLGMLAGITFVVLLIWLRQALESELQSLRVVFARARKPANDDVTDKPESVLSFTFWLLGMYQVFTYVSMAESLAHKTADASSTTKTQSNHQRVSVKRWLWKGTIIFAYIILASAVIKIDLLHIRLELSAINRFVDIILATLIGYFLSNIWPSNSRNVWQQLSRGLYWLPLCVLLAIFRNDIATIKLGLSISPAATLWLIISEVFLLIVIWLLILECARTSRASDGAWKSAQIDVGKYAPPKIMTARQELR